MKVKIILDSEEVDILYNAIANPHIRANKHPCENCHVHRIKPSGCECTVHTFYEKYLGGGLNAQGFPMFLKISERFVRLKMLNWKQKEQLKNFLRNSVKSMSVQIRYFLCKV